MADLYDLAELYDAAFAYRDVPSECSFLEALHRRERGRPPRSFLELAAGPGRHVVEMAARSVDAVGLDLSGAMRDYGLGLARERGVSIDYRVGDMRRFELGRRVDLAVLLMNSASYLHEDADVLEHLACVADHLEPDGLYMLEMSHPRDLFTGAESTSSAWDIEREDLALRVRWGGPDDEFDPTTQLAQVNVSLAWARDGAEGTHRACSVERRFTANELRALVLASGRFELVEQFGALDPAVPFGPQPEAWRMVTLLRGLG